MDWSATTAPTHHGTLDIAYLRSIPNMTVMAPEDEAELVSMLHTALRIDGPVAIRYPRGAGIGVQLPDFPEVLAVGTGQVVESGERVALVGYGYGSQLARAAAEHLRATSGITPTVVNARFVRPVDGALMRQLAARHELVVTIEDHAAHGGFGSAVLEEIADMPTRTLVLGLPDRFIDHGRAGHAARAGRTRARCDRRAGGRRARTNRARPGDVGLDAAPARGSAGAGRRHGYHPQGCRARA